MIREHHVLFLALLISGVLWAQEGANTEKSDKGVAQGSEISSGTTTPPDSTKLEPIKIAKAVYPQEARANKLAGRVVVKIVISETGDVDSAEVVSGDPVLATAALAAARQWKFKPYIRGGKAVKVSTTLPCDFSAPDDLPEETPASSAPNPAPSPSPDPMNSSPPVVREKTEVKYPGLAILAGTQGSVLLRLDVSEIGNVEHVQVLSGDPVLARATIDSVRKWKFQPATKDGKPIEASTDLNFNFAFKDKVVDFKPYTPPPPQSSLLASGQQDPASSPPFIPQQMTAGMVIHRVQPIYPAEAKAARIQGAVVLAAVIAKDGTVKNLRVVSGSRALVDAAVGAVQQWRYRPYMVNGEPVEVQTRITVNFSLGQVPPQPW